jgi:3-oxoacyl-[acyl-carrier-protein] synthase-1
MPVHIVGAGIISSIGNSYDECFISLQNERHGIAPLTSLNSRHRGAVPVGEVSLSNETLAEKASVSSVLTRTALLGLHAAEEAITSSSISNIASWRIGLISATTVGGMDRSENFFPSFLKDASAGDLRDVLHHGCGASTDLIAERIGVKDFVTTINTACSSSVNSLMLGVRLINHGQLDVVIAGGTDALTKFTLNGFKSLMILDNELCRPFDAMRKGLNLGEGAAYLVLVSDRVLHAEKLRSRAVISGFANTNDAFHQTGSSPEGRGSFLAMEKALTQAGLTTADIDYINLHGTGTVNNDASEATAIRRLYGQSIPAISSTKAFTGHTLGACGAIEAVFSLMAIENQCVFPNLRFAEPMTESGLIPQTSFENKKIAHVMSNSFGFGGNCSSIIFSTSSTDS